ncbi:MULTISPECIES: FAD-dependent monooxygenase [Aphanothece]|uniref:FAD-dependent monooxygenase n=1 Tax=Aphanothece TaxID=1121 RepID=UPI003984C000
MLIVGAGPAGAGLALLLARRGVRVTLIEASTRMDRQFRGEALMPHGLAALEAMGLTTLVESLPHRALAGWRFVLDGGDLFRIAEPLEGPGEPACTLVSQPALLQALLLELQRHPSATVLLGHRVNGLCRQAQRIVGVQLADGSELRAELVVGCDGRHSTLRQQAGLALAPGGGEIGVLWFRLPAQGPDPLGGDFLTAVGEQGIFSAFASASGAMQLGWVPEGGGLGDAGAGTGWLERLAGQSPPELALWLRQHSGDMPDPVRLQVSVGLAERWWCPGLLLLGDAAHPMSPVRAQGINLALRDAWLAGQLLLEVLQQAPDAEAPDAEAMDPEAIDAVLARIEARRRPEVVTVQRLQARETSRGLLLRRHAWLRRGLIAAAPWLAPALAAHWRHSQHQLRQGTGPLGG